MTTLRRACLKRNPSRHKTRRQLDFMPHSKGTWICASRVGRSLPAQPFAEAIKKKRGIMNREYHKWYSPALQREMELLVFGHAGVPMIVFPTSMGRFFDYEDRNMIKG